MEKIREKLLNSTHPEQINDLLIKISKDLEEIDEEFIINLIKNHENKDHFNKIVLNLAWLIGELGKKHKISERLTEYLKDWYYDSDRWVRSEIIKAIQNFSVINHIDEQINALLKDALLEGYEQTVMYALKAISKTESISHLFPNILLNLLSRGEDRITDMTIKLLKKRVKNVKEMFKLLENHSKSHSIDKRSIRLILLNWIRSLNQLDLFKTLIESSDWSEKTKEKYFREINTFANILNKAI